MVAAISLDRGMRTARLPSGGPLARTPSRPATFTAMGVYGVARAGVGDARLKAHRSQWAEPVGFAMRYAEGRDPAKRLAEDGRLEPTEALSILGRVADALDAAHRRGLIHRDVTQGARLPHSP